MTSFFLNVNGNLTDFNPNPGIMNHLMMTFKQQQGCGKGERDMGSPKTNMISLHYEHNPHVYINYVPI